MDQSKDLFSLKQLFAITDDEDACIEYNFDNDMDELFDKAYALAAEVHKDHQLDNGEPFMTHIDAVIDILKTEVEVEVGVSILITAALHDVFLGRDALNDDILESEFPKTTAKEIKLLTKTEDVPTADYLQNMEDYEYPRTLLHIKLADRLHNVRHLKKIKVFKVEQLKRYIEETKVHYIPLAKKYDILHDELVKALESLA